MLRPILAGIETEYGLHIDGRGAEDQVDDAMALVRGYPGECHVGWDYRYESPRSDLRGFKLDRLAFDPVDAKYDSGRKFGEAHEVRSDRVLPNGARFYNDHGHPEYSTPECLSIHALARHDCAGQLAVLNAARAYSKREGREAKVYKNNTDFHGASYGTHEGYLVPREVGFDRLFKDLLPMLVARQVLVGAGKVGAEHGPSTTYQLSQRADFFTEAANAETLFRRPIFNTRDEPHADASQWIRLHVICGDANMIPAATARKVGLVKLALHLCEAETAPKWSFVDPVRAFQAISRDEKYAFRVELAGRSWTDAYEILESYFAAAEATLDLDEEMRWTIDSSRALLDDLRRANMTAFRREVDWAAKLHVLEQVMEEEGTDWRDPALRSYDLEYHNANPEESLHAALVEMGEVSPDPERAELLASLEGVDEPTRALARGLAVRRFDAYLRGVCWRTLTFNGQDGPIEVDLPPDAAYPAELAQTENVGSFIELLRGVKG
ncbi:proteasome accessory factor PafA2 family protein [Fimbriimonas ginsengisoli]|uniref:Pup ligase n=1 Tax=Fimbriimonas ginsengisoli Gsoil 348 TaxID=661478 RepID=A0A068NN29_FIMGI|nr:proteasome accessory factor PafA2 family protein [Fimbriimonas ginsengisoli]AIE84807.1 Pup ligase [Fimbriimonas ginsengisoli Gsoil 348]